MTIKHDMPRAKPLINLFLGWPSKSLLPISQVRTAAQRALSDASIAVPGMLYGPDSGFQPLRESLARWLTNFYEPKAPASEKSELNRAPVTADRVIISGGASQNIGCLLNTFTDPVYTRNVWMISPTYHLAIPMFNDGGFSSKIRALPEDDEGVDVAWLRREVEKAEKQARKEGNDRPLIKTPPSYAKVYRHVIYAVPSFSNPSSKTMTMLRREELVRCARDFDALIICDDVYDMLHWPVDGPVPDSGLYKAILPRLLDIDRYLDGGAEREGADGFGNVVSNATFSKLCGPGCRSGWTESTSSFAHALSQTGITRSGGAASQLTATFMCDMLDTGVLQEHILKTLQPAYSARYRRIMNAIESLLIPLGFKTNQQKRDIAGGYFVWLTLPGSLNATEVTSKCLEEENLIVAPGSKFEVPGDNKQVNYPDKIRLCFAWEEEQLLDEGVQRIARVAESLLQNRKGGR